MNTDPIHPATVTRPKSQSESLGEQQWEKIVLQLHAKRNLPVLCDTVTIKRMAKILSNNNQIEF